MGLLPRCSMTFGPFRSIVAWRLDLFTRFGAVEKKRNRASIDLVWVFSRVRNPSKPANRNYALANFDLPACGVTSASRGYEERDTCHSAFVVRSEIDSFSGRLRASFHLQPLTQAVPSLRFGVPSSFSSTSSRSSPSFLLFPPLPPLRVPKHPLHVGYILLHVYTQNTVSSTSNSCSCCYLTPRYLHPHHTEALLVSSRPPPLLVFWQYDVPRFPSRVP